MSWADLADMENVQVLDGGSRVIQAGVLESAPSQAEVSSPGQVSQQVTLLLPSGERLNPPLRLMVDGSELRVVGTQAAPFPDAPSLVTCERINPNLPDEVTITEETGSAVLDVDTGLYVTPASPIWSGAAHVVSGVPGVVEAGGEDAPLDKVTITVPLSAPYGDGFRMQVTSSRAPGLQGAAFKLSGEVLDSTASLRRMVGYRQGA